MNGTQCLRKNKHDKLMTKRGSKCIKNGSKLNTNQPRR